MNRYGKLFAIMLCALVACKKKDGANQNLDPNKQKESNYMSIKPGSWWLFGARNGEVTRRSATGTTETKNGLLFSVFDFLDTTKTDPTPEYFATNDGKYISLQDLDGSKENYVTLVFLKDSAKAGDYWENTQDYKFQIFNTNLLVESTVEFVDGTLTLGGKTYTRVTKVHNNLRAKTQLQPVYNAVGRLDIWFAKGIGIIQRDIDVKVLTFEKKHMDSLLEYHIAE